MRNYLRMTRDLNPCPQHESLNAQSEMPKFKKKSKFHEFKHFRAENRNFTGFRGHDFQP